MMFIKKNMRNNWLIIICIVLISVLFITSCGSSKESRSNANYEMQAKTESKDTRMSDNVTEEVKFSESGISGNKQSKTLNETSERKIIQNIYIKMQTLEFDKTNELIVQKTNSIGGYIQHSHSTGRRIEDSGNIDNRSCHMVLRIPKDEFKNFSNEVGKLGNIILKDISGEDVTSQYYDTEAHLKVLKVQEERLLELLKKSGELKDIIELEKELANVRYEIENLTGTLKRYDNLVNYCTLTIDVIEVNKIKEVKNSKTFSDKILNGFISSIESLVNISKITIIVIAAAIPYIIIFGALFFIVRYILKKRNK